MHVLNLSTTESLSLPSLFMLRSGSTSNRRRQGSSRHVHSETRALHVKQLEDDGQRDAKTHALQMAWADDMAWASGKLGWP